MNFREKEVFHIPLEDKTGKDNRQNRKKKIIVDNLNHTSR